MTIGNNTIVKKKYLQENYKQKVEKKSNCNKKNYNTKKKLK